MAIFPIIDGQKPNPDYAIPAQKRAPKQSEPATADATPDAAKVEPVKAEAPKEQPEDDLIDFGQNDEPAEKAPEPVKQPSEIEQMLASTGKPAEGPLLDFMQDLKKDLPSGSS